MSHTARSVATLVIATLGVARLDAQQPAPTAAAPSTACDSIVAAARQDQIETGLYLSVRRVDGGAITPYRAASLVLNIGAVFEAPRPFRLSVFSGPPRMQYMRSATADTAGVLRAPTLTGIYRITSVKNDTTVSVALLREPMLEGFDEAAVIAIKSAARIEGLFTPPSGQDSMTVDVRFSSDSTPGAYRLVAASFPRMRVVDAAPLPDNPRPAFPAEAVRDSLVTGEIVLRFIIGRDGKPIPQTTEVVRWTAMSFIRATLAVLDQQRFRPATIAGCPVFQQIDYAFSFVSPNVPPNPPPNLPPNH